ncbi:MAG: metal ABC transporter permease [Planctomycetales bacterium]|nr:metal ABC transporter permease [bacterium]UNM09276.1 MAG: metal ABC transporter permease [Planctomycetales bacterium]
MDNMVLIFIRIVACGMLIGFSASYYGAFVVQRGMSFLGNGLAHAAFGGVALGILLGSEPLWVALPFTVLAAIGINWLKEHTRLAADSVIGLFFALSMAMGIIFLSRVQTYSQDAMTYLFGSLLSVGMTNMELYICLALTAITICTFPLWPRWAYSTFDRESARIDGQHVRREDYLLSILIAVTVVVAAKLVGIVLLSAFLVIPAAAARLISASFAMMTTLSVVIGVFSVAIGFALSYQADMPTGACVVMTQILVFALMFAMNKRGVRWPREM